MLCSAISLIVPRIIHPQIILSDVCLKMSLKEFNANTNNNNNNNNDLAVDNPRGGSSCQLFPVKLEFGMLVFAEN